MSDELLPCPFCGASAIVERFESAKTPYEYVSCVECDASTDTHCAIGESAEKWNTRATPANADSVVKIAEDVVENYRQEREGLGEHTAIENHRDFASGQLEFKH